MHGDFVALIDYYIIVSAKRRKISLLIYKYAFSTNVNIVCNKIKIYIKKLVKIIKFETFYDLY